MKSPKNYLIALLALTTVGGSILAWQQYGELVELRAAAMNKDERADLQKRAWDLERLNKQLRDQRSAETAAIPIARAGLAVAQSPPITPCNRPKPSASSWLDPRFRRS